jgi:hypothetical protein
MIQISIFLKRIYLEFNQIEFIENNSFSDMRILSVLRLTGNNIKSIDNIGIHFNLLMASLELGYNQIEAINLDFKQFVWLGTVNLTNNRLKSIDFINFSFHPFIKLLDLSQNFIENITNHQFEVLDSLKKIDISRNPIQSFKNIEFPSTVLKEIRVSISNLDLEAIDELRRSVKPQVEKHLRGLNMVYLKSIFIEDDDYPLNCSTTLLFLRENVLFNLYSFDEQIHFYQICSNFILE